ncbi:MAG: ABC transporter substrate-binding protein, partial [Candidatus Heimdallarchaeaceae archaeon]
RKYDWLSNIYVDPFDELAFHIHIDGDPDTPEKEPFPDFWLSLDAGILPEFFLNSSDSTVYFTSGGVKCVGIYPQIRSSPQWNSYIFSSPFGSGVYLLNYVNTSTMAEFRRGQSGLRVGAIDGVEGVNPIIERINIHVIHDYYQELDLFKAGKLDLMELGYHLAERRQIQADPRFDVQSLLNPGMIFLFYNLRRPFIGGADNYVFLTDPGKEEYTKSVAVRKAINHAINREEMNQILHDEDYLIAHSVMYPYSAFFYYDDIIKYDYDLEKAFEWLSPAHYGPIPSETSYSFVFISVFCVGIILLRRKSKKLNSS